MPDAWAPAMLYGAAAVDLLLGAATLARPGKALWWAQIGLIVLYTVIISWKLPEFWLHPYGPVLKNLPILAALSLLIALEPARPAR
ncbi:DoxX-like family protein [Ideonella sp. DXS29W]|uniref:DoxX-like family protein n=1 Tax=Ideonella lacteola TaxID=2984193 RepID=A0ABU9BS96_9BURK